MITDESFKEVQKWDELIPEPVIQRQPTDYGDAGKWKRTWIYLTVPNEFMVMKDWKATLPNGSKVLITEEEQFVFDGASIPWFLRPFATSFGPLLRAGLAHDYGYRFDYLKDWEGNKIHVGAGQKYFDQMFRDVAKVTTHLGALSGAAWGALKWFGKLAWKNRRKEDMSPEEIAEIEKAEQAELEAEQREKEEQK